MMFAALADEAMAMRAAVNDNVSFMNGEQNYPCGMINKGKYARYREWNIYKLL
jgi:hypothetical protein